MDNTASWTASDYLIDFISHNKSLCLISVVAVILYIRAHFANDRAIEAEKKIQLLEQTMTAAEEDKEKARLNSISLEDNQIKAVKAYNGFERKKIFNKEESEVFYLVQDILKQPCFKAWHVHGQVSLGQIIKTSADDWENYQSDRAHKSINSKRADMVVTNTYGLPVLLIEYNGDGHYGDTSDSRDKANKRDLVKNIAAEKAGIGVVTLLPERQMSKEQKHALISASLFDALAQAYTTQKAKVIGQS